MEQLAFAASEYAAYIHTYVDYMYMYACGLLKSKSTHTDTDLWLCMRGFLGVVSKT